MNPLVEELVNTTGAAPARVLIADDQPDMLEALDLLLRNNGFQVQTVNSPAAVLEAIGGNQFDLLLMDLNYARDTTSGREGLDLLAHLESRHDMPIVVMTGWGSIELAVEAMQHGVGDFVQKPGTTRVSSIRCASRLRLAENSGECGGGMRKTKCGPSGRYRSCSSMRRK